jgi:Zn-dependent peptidase ImmA (M78 family)
MIKDVSFIPDKVIEKKALVMLAGFEAQYGKVTHPPVPIDRLVECYLDLWIDWDDIADTDEEKILGCLDPNARKIYMNTRHRDHFEDYIGTESYTKAHEVGHWDMHVARPEEMVQLSLLPSAESHQLLCRASRRDPREIQAERYAAYLLMPHHLVMSEIEGLDIWQWPTLYDLQRLFGVTISAFTNRLKGLGLIYISPNSLVFHSEEEYQGIKSMF